MPSAGDMAMARELQAQFSRQGGGSNSRSSRGRRSSRGPPMESQKPFQPAPAPCAMPAPQPPGGSVWSGPLLTPADLARRQEPPAIQQPPAGGAWSGPMFTTFDQARRQEPEFQSAFAAPVNNTAAPSYPTEDHPQTMFSYNEAPFTPPIASVRSDPATDNKPGEYAPRSPLAQSTNLAPTAPVFKPRQTNSSAMSVDSDYNSHLNGFRTSGVENSQAGAGSRIVQSGMASGRGLSSSRWA